MVFDADLVLIFSFILAVLMVVLPFAYVINRKEMAHKERKLELEARKAEAEAALTSQGTADYRKLEERVRVLERIATDGNHNLALQIEQLRNLHEIDALTTKERAQ